MASKISVFSPTFRIGLNEAALAKHASTRTRSIHFVGSEVLLQNVCNTCEEGGVAFAPLSQDSMVLLMLAARTGEKFAWPVAPIRYDVVVEVWQQASMMLFAQKSN